MKNRYKITKDLMLSWANGHHFRTIGSILMLLISCYLAIFGSAEFIRIFYLYGYHLIYVVELLALEMILGAFAVTAFFKIFFQPRSLYKKAYNRSALAYGTSEWTCTIELSDDDIIYTEHTTVVRYQYKNIVKIRDKKDSVMIFFNHGAAIILYKNAFVDCSWEDCKKLIAEKRHSR